MEILAIGIVETKMKEEGYMDNCGTHDPSGGSGCGCDYEYYSDDGGCGCDD